MFRHYFICIIHSMGSFLPQQVGLWLNSNLGHTFTHITRKAKFFTVKIICNNKFAICKYLNRKDQKSKYNQLNTNIFKSPPIKIYYVNLKMFLNIQLSFTHSHTLMGKFKLNFWGARIIDGQNCFWGITHHRRRMKTNFFKFAEN